MLTVLGVDLLRDGSGARRSRVLAVVVLRGGCTARRDEDGDLLFARRAMVVVVVDGEMGSVDGGVGPVEAVVAGNDEEEEEEEEGEAAGRGNRNKTKRPAMT